MHLELYFKKLFIKKEMKAVKVFYKKIKSGSHTDINMSTS